MTIPIFLFSLPRSGSTFVQRVLATHPAIATTNEPWMLLPLVYAMRVEGSYAEYDHRGAQSALARFAGGLPGGLEEFRAALARLVLELYRRHGRDRPYFLDKTPRYSLIVGDLIEMFQQAKFVFLWRNPLAVAASIITTWGNGYWNLYKYNVDLYVGMARLIAARAARPELGVAVRYEDLVKQDEEAWSRLFAELELPFDADALRRFAEVDLQGEMGDPARDRYRAPSPEPLEKWKGVLGSPVRKAWCRRYLDWLGRDRLAVMGYDLTQLQAELDRIPAHFRTIPSDLATLTYGLGYTALEARIAKAKVKSVLRGEPWVAHA